MKRSVSEFCRNADGAVAPTVALSLIALFAAAGIGFDYARLVNMDTEIQDAADHAALAAATQLDGGTGAQTRATTAAQSLITNRTRFATGATPIGIASVTFYSAYTDPTNKTLATGDADSKFVLVQMNTRTARYALTPIVRVLSGSTNASAVASVSSAICGVVPFFVCNPGEPSSNSDPALPPTGIDTGAGIVMAEGGTQWGPGNFGFLDQLGNGANGVAEALASNTLFENCSQTTNVTTETGNILNAVRDSLNMRFDFKPGNASACKSPPCAPSTNVIKDVVKEAGNCSWQAPNANAAELATATPPKYFPPDLSLPSGKTPQTMGHPRDLCHYFQDSSGNFPLCTSGRIGDGSWDRTAYFNANHPGVDWKNDPDLGANVTRYQTYLWEAQDTSRLPTNSISGSSPQLSQYGQPQAKCLSPGLAPDPAGIDRRRITAAVVNCRYANAHGGLNGKKTLIVGGYIDVFLVEPSIARSRCSGTGCSNTFTVNGKTYVNAYGSANDIYVEVIGASGTGEGGGIPQITRRDIPRLIE
ncbi:MAG: pilus assembly protein TadG-related protein [Sphingomicrobium sp.]